MKAACDWDLANYDKSSLHHSCNFNVAENHDLDSFIKYHWEASVNMVSHHVFKLGIEPDPVMGALLVRRAFDWQITRS